MVRKGFERKCYISALEHVKMLILSSYVLLACKNAIYKYGLDELVRCILSFSFWAKELYIWGLKCARKV